jgi:hypothetical protein
MPKFAEARVRPVLDPMDRISEILFGLIMVLTYTSTLSVVTADRVEVRTMMIGALGCNLAWGIIDAGLYLMACLSERARNRALHVAGHSGGDPDTARQAIADALPEAVAKITGPEQLEAMRRKLLESPVPRRKSHLTRDDWLGALAICLLVFFSTFPVVIPFLLVSDAWLALRISNGVAIVMLALCGYAFGRYSGLQPWLMALVMVAIGAALAGVAIALGG